jgi:hypothetical protein
MSSSCISDRHNLRACKLLNVHLDKKDMVTRLRDLSFIRCFQDNVLRYGKLQGRDPGVGQQRSSNENRRFKWRRCCRNPIDASPNSEVLVIVISIEFNEEVQDAARAERRGEGIPTGVSEACRMTNSSR